MSLAGWLDRKLDRLMLARQRAQPDDTTTPRSTGSDWSGVDFSPQNQALRAARLAGLDMKATAKRMALVACAGKNPPNKKGHDLHRSSARVQGSPARPQRTRDKRAAEATAMILQMAALYDFRVEQGDVNATFLVGRYHLREDRLVLFRVPGGGLPAVPGHIWPALPQGIAAKAKKGALGLSEASLTCASTRRHHVVAHGRAAEGVPRTLSRPPR